MKLHFESILIGIGFVLVIFAFLLNDPAARTRERIQYRVPTAKKLTLDEQKVERYRREIGDRLNSQRIQVQYDNIGYHSAKSRGHSDESSVLSGVPLDGEKHSFTLNEKKAEVLHNLESEIRESVEFERHLRDWETNARAQFVAEFIARAEAMGYRVQIDDNWNVFYEYVGTRAPQSIEFQIPLLLLAPRCQI